MRKTVIFILSFILIGFIHSCDNKKSMQEYIREEKKAIERYILSERIEVLNKYPEDSIFNENQYFKTSEGLYMNVVDRGNTDHRAQPLRDLIIVRFDYLYEIKAYVSGTTDSIVYKGDSPIEFQYDRNYRIISDRTGYACPGFAIPLKYIGEGAVVNLIIPSELGSTYDNNRFAPVFYRNLKYTKFY